ncbi:MDR family MFS transporter [Streptomyces sp. CA-111067]|uniref:MDR family MFS transporter n=1 Tax=Streptomyces sp. CA-111067 TaxID=3240046 RepID=UPI003D9728A1
MSGTRTSPAPGAKPPGLDRDVLTRALVLVLGAVAPLLDSTVVNVALRDLGQDLHAGVGTVQWVSTGYLLALAMAVPLSGWTVERFGARRMWLLSLLLFLGGSLLCGAAWNIGALIAFRVVQGVGGGLMIPIMQTLLMRSAGGRQIGRLIAVVSLPALVAPIFGPVIGGLVLSHWSWRWIFYVNLPICLAAVALALRHLPADGPGRPGLRLDVRGLLLLSPALAAVIYGLSSAGGGGFVRVQVLAPVACGAALLAVYARTALRTPAPLIDLRLFRVRSFSASSALLFLSGLAMFGAMLLLPLYYQQVRGQGVVAAGLLLAPQGVGSLLARGAGGLTDRIGPRPVVLGGIALTALGTVPFAFGVRHTDYWVLGAALVVRGAGLSAANMAVMVGAFRDLAPDEIPHASSTTRIMQQVGGSFGAAVLAVILQRELAGSGGQAAAAYGHTFTWALGFTALAVLPALLLPSAGRPAGPAGPADVAGAADAASPSSTERTKGRRDR